MVKPSFEDEYLAGVDEVGRGPLVGDVVAAAVILPKDCQLPLMDSKKLSEKKREALYDLICKEAISYAIAKATPSEIDEMNILQASLLAMKRAVEALSVKPNMVYVDGNKLPKWDYPAKAIVKGDSLIKEISAASILAKVYRDRQMIHLDKAYPQYGFAKHKGYPTKAHLDALQNHGLLSCYRKSFKPVKSLMV